MEDEAGTTEIIDGTNAPDFSAFISYSHADAAKVRKLHSQIESYRLPAGLGSIDALNSRKGRIGKVFRDREDLSAAQDLSAAVKDALDRSHVLVVACSPDAKASQWVDQEIAFFRERHPDRPILAAILRGEPDEAFPGALTEGGSEPLAADLRKQGDGWRLGFLKVVAGIAGVPLDRLVQRDSQRQVRRVMAVTGLVAFVAVAMGVMTTIAVQARNEAQFQQAEAEGLVSYMLGELRTELKGVGRLDVMQGVNERVLEYYSKQGDLSPLSPEGLIGRSATLQAMGEDDEARGDLRSASEKFSEAHRVTLELLERDPGNPDRLFAHAQSVYWLGFVEQREGNFDAALQSYEEHIDLLHRAELTGYDPEEVGRALGWAHNAIGVVYLEGQEEPAQAVRHFRQYNEVFRTLVQTFSRKQIDLDSLADSYGWLAQAYAAQEEHRIAVDARHQQIEVLDNLLESDPANSELLWSKIGAERAVFRQCYLMEDNTCASNSIERARIIIGQINFDTANRYWLWQAAYVALDDALLAIRLGRISRARSSLNLGRQFSRRFQNQSRGSSSDADLLQDYALEIERDVRSSS